MRAKTIVALFAVAMLVVGAGRAGAADEKKPAQKMTPEQQAAMDAYMKAATPGPSHKLLEPTVGTFDAAVTTWETPGAPGQVSKGVAENIWILGGRWVRETYRGEFDGMPFEGIGYSGYDNLKQKYVSSWIDSMSTMMMITMGTVDATGKVFTCTGTLDDAVTGKAMAVREVVRVVDQNKHIMETYGPDRSGKEFKMMEIVYTRK